MSWHLDTISPFLSYNDYLRSWSVGSTGEDVKDISSKEVPNLSESVCVYHPSALYQNPDQSYYLKLLFQQPIKFKKWFAVKKDEENKH